MHGFCRPARNDEIPSDMNLGGSLDHGEMAKNLKMLIISKTGGPTAKITLFSDLPPITPTADPTRSLLWGMIKKKIILLFKKIYYMYVSFFKKKKSII